ncbi:efflux RND transporter periplasmic adaptor subunit [Pseudooceanicola sp.]|uniref:efflux RND transporter periplasmic adaptor subunit n=1 Tax=Pseudooceanicola sp. TaxID=1914328 RepID=UPI0040590354
MSDTPKKPAWTRRGDTGAKDAGREPYRRRRRWIAPVVILIAIVATGGYLLSDPEATAVPEDEVQVAEREPVMQLLPSELTELEPRTLRETIRVTGSLDPTRKLEIPAEVSGRIDEVTHQPGEAVEAGEVLVRIGIDALTNQLEQQRANAEATRAQLELAQAEYERTQSLVNRGVATVSTLDSQAAQVRQLEANLAAQERQVANAEDALEKATVTAPFDGIVSDRAVDPGAYVSPGTPLMTVVDLSNLTLEGVVPVLYAPMIRAGQTGQISVDGLGDRQFTGTVDRVAPVATAGTRMLPIYASIDNPDNTLRGGMFASGVLVLEQVENAIGIPAAALREDAEGRYVLKLDGARVVRQPVEVARSWDNGRLHEVTSGLSAGDVIVNSAMARLQPGMQVTLVEG